MLESFDFLGGPTDASAKGPLAEAQRWPGVWPQGTLEEAEEAQRRSDAGDATSAWQADQQFSGLVAER